MAWPVAPTSTEGSGASGMLQPKLVVSTLKSGPDPQRYYTGLTPNLRGTSE